MNELKGHVFFVLKLQPGVLDVFFCVGGDTISDRVEDLNT